MVEKLLVRYTKPMLWLAIFGVVFASGYALNTLRSRNVFIPEKTPTPLPTPTPTSVIADFELNLLIALPGDKVTGDSYIDEKSGLDICRQNNGEIYDFDFKIGTFVRTDSSVVLENTNVFTEEGKISVLEGDGWISLARKAGLLPDYSNIQLDDETKKVKCYFQIDGNHFSYAEIEIGTARWLKEYNEGQSLVIGDEISFPKFEN